MSNKILPYHTIPYHTVCPSSVEINSADRSAEPIDLKIGFNVGN